jgi:hypothetical protein
MGMASLIRWLFGADTAAPSDAMKLDGSTGATLKKRGPRERSSPPCQIKTLILPRCPEARGNIDLDLTLTRKFCELSGHAAQPSRITSAHHQTVFKPPFMTASAPPLAFMIVNSGPRWLPEPETFGSSRGGAAAQRRSWPSAATLRLASKWWASLLEESSRPH